MAVVLVHVTHDTLQRQTSRVGQSWCGTPLGFYVSTCLSVHVLIDVLRAKLMKGTDDMP